MYCGSGWLPLVDVLTRKLAARARAGDRQGDELDELTVWDRRRPLAEVVDEVDVLLPSNAHIDADVIAAAPHLRLIQQPAAGVDNIDREAARARGIPVCNAPGTNHVSVAEAALLLILALARRLPVAMARFRAAELGAPQGIELAGRTLGIVGMGRSGEALGERARALGMTVVGTRSSSSQEELDGLLATADVVSLHCPLTEATRGLIDARALARMKPGALLVNCARGPVLDREAVSEALASGHLGGLGLDTYWQEPWDPDDPLYQRDDVVTLPHVAGSTEESFDRITDVVCDNVDRLRRGQPLLHQVS
ncbi:2-hydroxyacid dehydrogenase [Haliangium sp.]|uniref:2-hydroxyacid dehydrogenase n=1 Tax=Haliangium sp. TaxID=2663208 RepID=UPI003D1215C9